jgi:hypothetical protein
MIEEEIKKDELRELRNSIIGSFDNKLYFLQNKKYCTLLDKYLSKAEYPDKEELNLTISIINSYLIFHNKIIKSNLINKEELQKKYLQLPKLTIQYIQNTPIEKENIPIFENYFHLLSNLISIELFEVEQYFNNFLLNIEQYMINESIFQSLCIVLAKVCENNYFKQIVTKNTNLIDKIIRKFYTPKLGQKFQKNLIKLLISLTEEDNDFCKAQIGKNNDTKIFFEKINKQIRFYEKDILILSIKLLSNVVLAFKGSDISPFLTEEAKGLTIWSLKIIFDLISKKNDNALDIDNKIICLSSLGSLLKFSDLIQNHFNDLDGINLIFKEFDSIYSTEELNQINEKIKNIKKNKKNEKENPPKDKENDEIKSIDSKLNQKTKYEKLLIDCLANSCESSDSIRKKIVENSHINIILNIILESNQNYKLILSSIILILNISRGKSSIKTPLIDLGITGLLLKLTSHQNIDIQIQTTNALCNFLIENNKNTSEVLECVNRLVKIFKTTTHQKIRFNSIFAIKNILYSVNMNKEVKKNIMKKITYNVLIDLLKDPDIKIVEHTLLIFRILLYKTSDDIEEVLSNCKEQLLSNIFEKLNNSNTEYNIILNSLYVLSNISNGKENQKKSLSLELIQKIIQLVSHPYISIRYVSLIILNNLFISNDLKIILLEDKNIMENLENASLEKNLDKNLIPTDLEDFKATKELAIELISVIKNTKKNPEKSNNNNTINTNTKEI